MALSVSPARYSTSSVPSSSSARARTGAAASASSARSATTTSRPAASRTAASTASSRTAAATSGTAARRVAGTTVSEKRVMIPLLANMICYFGCKVILTVSKQFNMLRFSSGRELLRQEPLSRQPCPDREQRGRRRRPERQRQNRPLRRRQVCVCVL